MNKLSGMFVVLGLMLTACGPMSPEDAPVAAPSEAQEQQGAPASDDAMQSQEDVTAAACGCRQDGCCSILCYSDPDCVCVPGKYCTKNSDCGYETCNTVTNKCSCLIQ